MTNKYEYFSDWMSWKFKHRHKSYNNWHKAFYSKQLLKSRKLQLHYLINLGLFDIEMTPEEKELKIQLYAEEQLKKKTVILEKYDNEYSFEEILWIKYDQTKIIKKLQKKFKKINNKFIIKKFKDNFNNIFITEWTLDEFKNVININQKIIIPENKVTHSQEYDYDLEYDYEENEYVENDENNFINNTDCNYINYNNNVYDEINYTRFTTKEMQEYEIESEEVENNEIEDDETEDDEFEDDEFENNESEENKIEEIQNITPEEKQFNDAAAEYELLGIKEISLNKEKQNRIIWDMNYIKIKNKIKRRKWFINIIRDEKSKKGSLRHAKKYHSMRKKKFYSRIGNFRRYLYTNERLTMNNLNFDFEKNINEKIGELNIEELE